MADKIPQLPHAGEFTGKIALVTGGSDGLGKHLVQQLVRLGAQVHFNGTSEAKGKAAAAELGPKAHFARVDLQDAGATEAWVKSVGSSGSIDFLVNNAATDPRIEFETATLADFDKLISINLRSYFVVSHSALPFLKKGAGKSIVNVCTTNYMLGLSPFTLYNASKSGIIGFSRSLARELGPLGIRVNVVSPGWIMTRKQLAEHVTEKDKQDLLDVQAMKFLLNEEHVTPLTLFLLSAASMGITGQNLVVDGGKVMQ